MRVTPIWSRIVYTFPHLIVVTSSWQDDSTVKAEADISIYSYALKCWGSVSALWTLPVFGFSQSTEQSHLHKLLSIPTSRQSASKQAVQIPTPQSDPHRWQMKVFHSLPCSLHCFDSWKQVCSNIILIESSRKRLENMLSRLTNWEFVRLAFASQHSTAALQYLYGLHQDLACNYQFQFFLLVLTPLSSF